MSKLLDLTKLRSPLDIQNFCLKNYHLVLPPNTNQRSKHLKNALEILNTTVYYGYFNQGRKFIHLQGKIPEDGKGSSCSKILSPMRRFIPRPPGKGINTVVFLIDYLIKKLVVIQAFLFPSWITEIWFLADNWILPDQIPPTSLPKKNMKQIWARPASCEQALYWVMLHNTQCHCNMFKKLTYIQSALFYN